MTFQSSNDNATFSPVYDEGTQYSVAIGTSRHVALKKQAFDAVRFVRLVSTSTETAARTITIISGE